MRVLASVLIIGALVLGGVACGNDAVCVESEEGIQCYDRAELGEIHEGVAMVPKDDGSKDDDPPYIPPGCAKCHQPATSGWADISVRLRDYDTLRNLARVEPLDLTAAVH
jgi:hypothetical protein